MLASASALEFEKLVEEDLGSVSASIGDLIAMDSGDMAIKSWDLPYIPFLHRVLETFNVQLHHLTPTAFLTLSKFCWACVSYGAELDVDTFCTYYEL